MKSNNIVAVIEKLGEIIIHNSTTISCLEYENEKLKEKIKRIEEYIEHYTDQDITDSDYQDFIK